MGWVNIFLSGLFLFDVSTAARAIMRKHNLIDALVFLVKIPHVMSVFLGVLGFF